MSEHGFVEAGLERVVNLGNYESTRISFNIKLPIDKQEGETVSEAVDRLAMQMYKDLSAQVSERYRYVKAMQSGEDVISFEEWKEKRK